MTALRSTTRQALGMILEALLRARRITCPDCGSHIGAFVGRVGAYRRCRRCHDCGCLF